MQSTDSESPESPHDFSSEETIRDAGIAKWQDSVECIEMRRIGRIADCLDSFIVRLDRYRIVEDAWHFWSTPDDKRPVNTPSAKDRWLAASKNWYDFGDDVSQAVSESIDFEDSKDVRVCLYALRSEITLERSGHDKMFCLAHDEERYVEAIRMMKQILKRIRWTLRPTLVLLASRIRLSSVDLLEKGLEKYLPAKFIGEVSAKLQPAKDMDQFIWLGAKQLAEKFGRSESAVATRLSRYRSEVPEGKHWRTEMDRGKGEPAYTHRLGSVRKILQEMPIAAETDR